MKYTIIGAGIGGLTTAAFFEQKGIDYQIFERAEVLKAVGAGIWLAPNALQALDSLGILSRVKDLGNPITQVNIAKKDFTSLSGNHDGFIDNEEGYSTIAIHRGDLQQALLEQIPQEKLVLGKTFESYRVDKDKKIHITFTDGQIIETDVLIGADGIHSKIRKQLFPESKTRYSGQTCWRGVLDITLDDVYQHQGVELWGRQIRFGLSAISKQKVYWFAVVVDQANGKDEGSGIKEKLLERFSEFHPLAQELIQSTSEDQIFRSDICDLQPLKQWYKGRIGLIGDAGHATTPNLGQGGAQAIEDAYYLSHLIEDNTPIDELFFKFQDKRYKKVNYIVKQSWTIGQIAHWDKMAWIRNLMVKYIPSALMKQKMKVLYQLEPISTSVKSV